MTRIILFLCALMTGHIAAAGEIKKIIDSNGHVMYTNMNAGFKGRIIKRFESGGITQYRNIPRPNLSGHVIKTGLNSYRFNLGSSYPTIFSRFSGRYSPSGLNKTRYTNLIADAASRNGVEERLLHAVIQTESAYNPSAVSRAGAVGLMQLMPDTARRYGVYNRTDPTQNVDAGSRYLKDLLDMFNYNLGLAVAAYNAGENAVIRYNNSIPPYRETQNYVRQVLSLYHGSM
jgi:soluble lytic murein transglycosylase-like protein